MSSLAKRVLTALVLVPLVIGAVLLLPAPYLAAALGLVCAAGAWEWAGLMGWTSRQVRAGYALSLIGVMGVVYLWAPAAWPAVVAGCLWWVVALVWVLRYQQGRAPVYGPAAGIALGWLLLAPAWAALMRLHALGPHFVLVLLVVIWAADTGAYFAGRRFGRRRLASRVSPGKTWEGAAGAVALVVPVALAGGLLLGLGAMPLLAFVALCAAVVPVSILGDLTESLFKREANVKDSGTLLPGHGGVLDRIDSLTAAAPVFALGLHALVQVP